jgi:Tol biopolymer transport system component
MGMWKQLITRWLISSFSVLILGLVLNLPINAQETGATVLVATHNDNGIHIYRVDAAGQDMLIASLTEFRVGESNDQDLWFIDHPNYLAVSPDGTRIAFTAQHGDESTLFIYTLETDTLHEITQPSALFPVWSPDSSAILLLPTTSSQPPYHVYVYDLNEDRSFRLTSDQIDESWFRWLPDGSGLTYMGTSVSCSDCSYYVEDLYFIDWHGKERRVLTDLYPLIPEGEPITICDRAWSELNQRIYYIVGCVGGGDEPVEYLYSVDVAGNNRAEISTSFSSIYPEESNVSTGNIHLSPSTADIYLTVRSQGGDGTSRSNWRILHLQAPDVITTVYEQTIQDESLDISSMSPDASAIALITYGRGASNGFLEVIDLETGQRIVERDVAPLDVCYTQWADENTLFYVVDPTGICALTYEPQTVWVLDITTSATHEVTDGLGDNVWLLRQ